MKKIMILLMLLVVIFISCGEPKVGEWAGIGMSACITNGTASTIYVGNLDYTPWEDSNNATMIRRISPYSSELVSSKDYDTSLFSTNRGALGVNAFRSIGFCMYSTEITNETNVFSYISSYSLYGHYGFYLDTADDPTNQVMPSSLIYRTQIITNEVEADGRYSWEVETNTRPFYIVCPTNYWGYYKIVITSIMTNIIN